MTKRFTHLLAEEKKLWILFLQRFGDDFINYEYDVHVGLPQKYPEGFPPNYSRMVIRLSQKRIDVVAYKTGTPYIFEIRPYPDLELLERLQQYSDLYAMEILTPVKPIKALVYLIIDEKTEQKADAMEIVKYKISI